MKRYGHIFEKICSMKNLQLAHKHARKDKTYYREVKMVDEDPDRYLGAIQDMLLKKEYVVSKYQVSIINDTGKERELMKLPYYPDRIIQWAIMLQVEPIFRKTFCGHTCASLKHRGGKRAMQYVDKFFKDRRGSMYCLKIDVRKFYPSINHEILKTMLRKKFKDPHLLELLDQIIDSYPGERGVPIGSYLSQFLANFYLAYFDHWLKETMRVDKVVRYMDDCVICHESKEYLHNLRKEIDHYLREELDLDLKSNWQVFPTNVRGIDFVGYRHFFDYRLLRKSTCKRFKKKMLRIRKKVDAGQMINYSEWCSANSYKGWLRWCDSFRLRKKYLDPIQKALAIYYLKVIQRKQKGAVI